MSVTGDGRRYAVTQRVTTPDPIRPYLILYRSTFKIHGG